MNLVGERGNYNASAKDLNVAQKTARGEAILADAGEDLIKNTFVIVYDFKYVNKEEVANKTKAGLGLLSSATSLLGGPDLSTATTVANAGLTVAGKGYVINTTAYLYRLVWDEETAARFYNEYWIDENNLDPAKKAAFENSTIFQLKFVGQENCIADIPTTVFTSKSDEELITIATVRGLDKAIGKLQRKYEEFRTKTPLYSTEPLAAQIGTKEDVQPGDEFEVLEQSMDANGKTTYTRKAVIRAGKEIWNNEYSVADTDPKAASAKPYTEFKGSSNGLYQGMLIKQIR
jgi:hypothetical protein